MEIDMKYDWLDCSTGAVVAGIRQSESGQLTRMYYESYGNPADDPGDHDEPGHEIRRVITLRATEAVPLGFTRITTIVFRDDDDGERYVFSKGKYLRADEEGGVLARVDGEDLVPIGLRVAFAIPDHGRMSPQLA
jgi:hypothetical protein